VWRSIAVLDVSVVDVEDRVYPTLLTQETRFMALIPNVFSAMLTEPVSEE
jgi:hypothetical protein